jgi:hypothetical protein
MTEIFIADRTPYNTVRIFTNREFINRNGNDELINVLDTMSIGGCDRVSSEHYSWEFDIGIFETMKRQENKFLPI